VSRVCDVVEYHGTARLNQRPHVHKVSHSAIKRVVAVNEHQVESVGLFWHQSRNRVSAIAVKKRTTAVKVEIVKQLVNVLVIAPTAAAVVCAPKISNPHRLKLRRVLKHDSQAVTVSRADLKVMTNWVMDAVIRQV
jgi:hypothetical protein